MSVQIKQFVETDLPSQRIINDAKRTVDIKDGQGRIFTLQKFDYLDQTRLVAAIGEERAQNKVYLGMVMPILFVKAIDGMPIPKIFTLNEIDALLIRLGETGMTAIIEGVIEHFPELGKLNEQEAKENIKK